MTTVDMASVVDRNKHFLRCRAPYLLRALSISMTTRTERAMVMGWGLSKISQSTPLNISSWARHWEWWVCGGETEGGKGKCQDKQNMKGGKLNILLLSKQSRMKCIVNEWGWNHKYAKFSLKLATFIVSGWLGGGVLALCDCVWVGVVCV